MQPKIIEKYLRHYASKHNLDLPELVGVPSHILLIPAYDEYESILKLLDCLPKPQAGALLTILLVNAHQKSPESVLITNQHLITEIGQRYPICWQSLSDERAFLHTHPSGELLVLDRSQTNCLNPKEGVGGARRILADLALDFMSREKVQPGWLHCTDADAILPPDYFSQSDLWRNDHNIAALVYPFEHHNSDDPALAQAAHLYEQHLQHYVDGLRKAGSPYAFHTIGSTLAISPNHYAQVRGFPRRPAGEDFYILNKLSKTGRIKNLGGMPIRLQARLSERVGFGTGKALGQISTLAHPSRDYKSYHPAVFDGLQLILATLVLSYDVDDLEQWQKTWPLYIHTHNLRCHPDIVKNAARSIGFAQAMQHARKHGLTLTGYLKHVHTWFDAFRTLKFIHFLEHNGYPRRSFPRKNLYK